VAHAPGRQLPTADHAPERLATSGAQYMPDSHTILFRAWKVEDEKAKKGGLPMTIYTVRDDGSGLHRVTTDEGTNWAPYPAPTGATLRS